MRTQLLLSALALAALPSTGTAQDSGRAPIVLLVPAGTRALGLGDAFVAGDGAEVLFYNPAQIGSRGSTLSLARFGRSATMGSLATAGRVAGQNMSIGVRYLDYGPDGFPEPAGMLAARGPTDGTSFDAMIGAEHAWYGIRFGGAAHYVAEQQNAGRAAGALFDLGASRSIAGIAVGLAVQSLGQSLELAGVSAKPPTRVTLGGFRDGIRVGTFFDLALAASVTREDGGRWIPAAGAELTYEPVSGWTVTGRMGVHRGDPAGVAGASAVTFGGSLGLDALSLDYSWQPYHGIAGGAHRIGLRIQ